MQENNFEKQVQQKMEELSFTPSAPVWQNVQAQIRKKKERKRIIFWLFPLIIATGALLLVNSNYFSFEKTQATQEHGLPHKTTTQQQQQSSVPAESHLGDNISILPPHTPAGPNERNIGGKKAIPDNEAINNHKELIRQNSTTALSEQRSLDKRQAVNQEIEAEPTAPGFGTGVIKSDEIIASDETTSGPVDTAGVRTTVTQESDSLSTRLQEPVEAAVVEVPKKPGAAKWKFAINVVAARSSMRGKLFSDDAAKAFGRENLQGGFGSGPLNGGVFNNPPAQPKPGMALSLGVTAKRLAGKRTNVVSGLQYSFYSTRLSVGTVVNNQTVYLDNNSAMVTRVYQNDSARLSHTNKYHYVEVPFAIEYRPFKKIPVHVQHGFSFAYLFYSNAVQYYPRANVYFKDREALRRTNVQLFSSLNYDIINHKGFAWSAGPIVHYGMLGVDKKTSQSPEHLFSFGLKSSFSF